MRTRTLRARANASVLFTSTNPSGSRHRAVHRHRGRVAPAHKTQLRGAERAPQFGPLFLHHTREGLDLPALGAEVGGKAFNLLLFLTEARLEFLRGLEPDDQRE